jgi:hypothetical protein
MKTISNVRIKKSPVFYGGDIRGLLAVTNTSYQKEKAVSRKKAVFFVIWLPFVDSFRAFISTPTGEVRETLEAIQCFALL